MDLESEDTMDRIFNYQSPALIWFADTHDKNSEKYKIFEEVAKNFRGKLAFVSAGFDGETTNEFVEYFGIEEETLMGIVPLTEEEINKYLFTGEWTKENLLQWVDNFLSGKVKKHLKTEEIPKKNKGPVIKVVGKNYQEVVMDENKHVLIEFYAPWCEHCKNVKLVFLKKNFLMKVKKI